MTRYDLLELLHVVADEHGLDHPRIAEAASRVTASSGIDMGILLVFWAMVTKPTV